MEKGVAMNDKKIGKIGVFALSDDADKETYEDGTAWVEGEVVIIYSEAGATISLEESELHELLEALRGEKYK